MEKIILVAHGSMRKEANNMDVICKLLHNSIHPNCLGDCVKAAYLQFSKPHIKETLTECIKEGANKIIIHPFFLTAGNHVTEDIPSIIDETKKKNPSLEIIYTEPLGIHEKLIQVILDRIRNADCLSPCKIEQRSLEIIEGDLDLSHLPFEHKEIIKRVIHATADFDFMNNLVFHKEAVQKGLDMIRSGHSILTDVEMVRVGINEKLLRKWGGEVYCHISDKDVVEKSQQTNMTRAEIGIEKGLSKKPGIVVIGNAPTALLKTIETVSKYTNHLPLVIGVPVGFVNAIESKTLLSIQSFPFITNLSKKGGSPVAISIVNALLKMA
ncbi:MAG: precorrin-8X methylmutase [Thermodesulfovibrionales bacterium]|nr:precorrin-8X methylmutase [Thermodesulfovibrionales bacterium]